MAERGVDVDHATLNRWVEKYSVAVAREVRCQKTPTGRSWLCCTNRAAEESLHESSVVSGRDEQLDTDDMQDPKLGRVYPFAEAARIAIDLV